MTTDGCSNTHIIVNIEPSFGTIGVMLIMLVLFIIFKVLVPLFYWINNVIEQWSSNAEMKALARKQQANDKRTRQLIDKGVPAILYLRPFYWMEHISIVRIIIKQCRP